MSNIIHKVKDAVTGHHNTSSAPEGTHGTHNSRVANTADPRIDSDRDHRAAPGSTIGGNHEYTTSSNYSHGTSGLTGSNPTTGSSGLTGSHGTSGLTGSHGTSGLTGSHGTSGLTGSHGTSGTTGGFNGSSGTREGPHNSNMANKLVS